MSSRNVHRIPNHPGMHPHETSTAPSRNVHLIPIATARPPHPHETSTASPTIRRTFRMRPWADFCVILLKHTETARCFGPTCILQMLPPPICEACVRFNVGFAEY